MLLIPSRKDARWTSWLLCFKSLLRRSWAEIDYRCIYTLLLNNSGELSRVDDFAPCIWRIWTTSACCHVWTMESVISKKTIDSSSTSGCWEGVNLPRKDKMGCGWRCKNQTAWSLRSNCNSLRLVTPFKQEYPTKSRLVIFKRISSKLYSNLRRIVTNNRCVMYVVFGVFFLQPASS